MATQIAKIWNGSAFIAKPLKTWNGSSWTERQAKFWNGTDWLPGIVPFLTDSFTDTSGTLLSSHTGEVGAAWTKHPNYTGNAVISNANRMRWDSGGGATQAAYYTSATPGSAEYSVEATLFVASITGYMGITGRMSTSADTMYLARYDQFSTRWELYRAVTGSFTLLGSYNQTLTVNNSYAMRLEIKDSTKKLFVDNVERISSNDNTITAAGRVGIRLLTATNTTGFHLDNLSAKAFS